MIVLQVLDIPLVTVLFHVAFGWLLGFPLILGILVLNQFF